jgi:hypothetical protein
MHGLPNLKTVLPDPCQLFFVAANGDSVYVRDADPTLLQTSSAFADLIGRQIGVFGARLARSPKAMDTGPLTAICFSTPGDAA